MNGTPHDADHDPDQELEESIEDIADRNAELDRITHEHKNAPEPEPTRKTPPDNRRCTATTRATNERCNAYAVRDDPEQRCAGHAGLGIAADPESYSIIGRTKSAEVRRNRAELRKLGPQEALRTALVREGVTIADNWAAEAKQDWRAADGLYTRVFGKPKETVEVVSGGALEDIRSLSLAEMDELLLVLDQRARERREAELAEWSPAGEVGTPALEVGTPDEGGDTG